MDYVGLIGSLAGFCTTISFLPQVIKVVKTKSTHDISLLMFLIFITGVVFWLIYGLLRNDWPVTIANVVTFVLAGIILGYKIRYK